MTFIDSPLHQRVNLKIWFNNIKFKVVKIHGENRQKRHILAGKKFSQAGKPMFPTCSSNFVWQKRPHSITD